jgi:hypothetical protein
LHGKRRFQILHADVEEAASRKTSPVVRALAAAGAIPLVLVALFTAVIGGVMTETGASDTVLGIQGMLVFAATLSFLGAAGVGVAHAITGSRGTLTALGVLTAVSVLLGLTVVLGYSTWCTDCGSA